MPALEADRRLCYNADGSALVEETDPRAARLAYPKGRFIAPGDVERFGLTEKDGRVVLGEVKATPAPENKMVEAAEDKAEEWPLKTSPAKYLEKNPDGPNAELARRLLGE